jgi:hypothetical protein
MFYLFMFMLQKQFFEFDNDEDRIKNIYGNFTIEQFWDWWNDNKNRTMEVRIRDYNLIKEVANKLYLPYSPSGVYVNSYLQLKNVIAFARNKATMWFGIQPRKKNWTNNINFKVFGGKDYFVDEIAFIFIDIDRTSKEEGLASQNSLMNSNKLADLLLEKLHENNWDNSYIKICSGNGIQMLIKLDIPFKLPSITYDNEKQIYIEDIEFEKTKLLIRNGIGKQIINFCDKFKNDLNVFVDNSVFKLSVVGALPFTKNYKFNSYRWRGIIDIKEGKNEGLSDYCLKYIDNIKEFKIKNIFSKSRSLRNDVLIKPGELLKNPLAKFLYEYDFPNGGINNTLWFQLKILLRDSKFDLNNKEFIEYYNYIKKKHNRTFSLNIPEDKFVFDENTINNYSINNMMDIIYPLWPKRNKYNKMYDKIDWDIVNIINKTIELPQNNSLLDDLTLCKNLLLKNSYKNNEIIYMFTKGMIKKYGNDKAKYYFSKLYDKWFNYD